MAHSPGNRVIDTALDRQGIDMVASLTGGAVLVAGGLHLVGFRPVQLLLGLGYDVAGQIIAAQWILLGLFLCSSVG